MGTSGSEAEERRDLSPAETRQALLRSGWRQGSVLGPDLAARVEMLPHAQLDPNLAEHWYVVVSQDCDLMSGSFAAEPAVEVIVLKPVPQLDAQRMHLRNPRELHLEVATAAGGTRPVAARIWNRGYLDRRLLLEHEPSDPLVLSHHDVDLLSSFLRRRYDRVALPDTFVERLRPARAKLEKLLSDFPDAIVSVLIGLTPDGEPDPPDSPYELRMYVVLSDSVAFGDPGMRRSVQRQILDRLRPALRRCHGVEVEKVSVCDTDELSLGEFMGLIELDFEALRAEITRRGEGDTSGG